MRKIAFVFPGQGAQYVGMGQEIFSHSAAARVIFEQADHRLGINISKMCFSGSEEDLRLTANTQPAILTVSVALLKALEAEGIKADYAAGHSLGEYAALVAAGALEFSDAVWLVRQRGILMQEAVPPGEGTMAAVLGLSADKTDELCQEASTAGVVEPANYNCPGQIVIAGGTPAVEKAIDLAKSFGAKRAIKLQVSGPFHSSLLHPVSERLSELMGQVTINDAAFPVIANLTADVTTKATVIQDNLIRQVAAPVKWQQSVEKLVDLGVNTFIEIGPGKVLSGLIKKIAKNVAIYNIEDQVSLNKTLAALREAGINE